MDESSLTFTVTHARADQRLDVFLAEKLQLSRTQTRRLLDAGQVTFNDRIVTGRDKGRLLSWGDVIHINNFTRPAEARVSPNPALPLAVLDESDHHVVAAKPAGMAVHPLSEHETDTLLNAVIARYPHMQDVGEAGLRSGVVHRLDVDTSGAILFALTSSAWQRYRQAFADHQTRKRYHALVRGHPPGQGQAEVDLVIRQHHPARVAVARADHSPRSQVRRCDQRWRVLENFSDASLVQIELGTGFLHQIRVIMAHLGHPLIGDEVYNPHPQRPASAPRQMLHAAQLHVLEVKADCPYPPDFQTCLEALRRDTHHV